MFSKMKISEQYMKTKNQKINSINLCINLGSYSIKTVQLKNINLILKKTKFWFKATETKNMGNFNIFKEENNDIYW